MNNGSKLGKLIQAKLGLGLCELEFAVGSILTVIPKISKKVRVRENPIVVDSLCGSICSITSNLRDNAVSVVFETIDAVVKSGNIYYRNVTAKLILRQFNDNDPVVELWFSDDDIIRLNSLETIWFQFPVQRL